MNKISFARRKVNELVLRKEKSICNKFCEQNQDETKSTNKVACSFLKSQVLLQNKQLTQTFISAKKTVPLSTRIRDLSSSKKYAKFFILAYRSFVKLEVNETLPLITTLSFSNHLLEWANRILARWRENKQPWLK